MCSHINLPAVQLIVDVLKQKKAEEDCPLAFEDSEGWLKFHEKGSFVLNNSAEDVHESWRSKLKWDMIAEFGKFLNSFYR